MVGRFPDHRMGAARLIWIVDELAHGQAHPLWAWGRLSMPNRPKNPP